MINEKNTHIAIVGHDPAKMPQLHFPMLHPVILHELNFSKAHYASNSLAESRFFLANNYFNCDTEVVGCLTSSWNIKYFPHKLEHFLDWPGLRYFDSLRTYNSDRNIVLCSTLCYGRYAKANSPMWEINFQRHFRKSWPQTEWIGDILFKITGLKYNEQNISPYANQIICNIKLFNELSIFIKSIIDEIILHFGLYPNFNGIAIDRNRNLAYIMEEVTMLWWSQFSNIEYISCGKIIPGWYEK